MSIDFLRHVGLEFQEVRPGFSRCTLPIGPHHSNGHGAVHGGVLFTLADTGMGAALYRALDPGQSCATIEVKINYFRPVPGGTVVCTSELVYRGKRTANLDALVHVDGVLVAKANGTFSISARRTDPQTPR